VQLEKFDVIVVGGGPAGMMAAGKAAEIGASVALVEKNDRLGVKLAITGKGRCNLTHMEKDPLKLVEPFGRNGRFLLSSLSRFGVEDTLEFFRSRGVATKVERGSRVFPETGLNSEDVVNALSDFMFEGKVKIFTVTTARGLTVSGGEVTGIVTDRGTMSASSVIVTTGGMSYPGTGSTGDGYRWAKETGHRIVGPEPAICPVKTEERWCSELQGLTLRNVSISLWRGGKRVSDRFGEMLFTHFGISGPIVMDMAKEIGTSLSKGPSALFLDLKPALDKGKLDARILRDLEAHRRELLKNGLKDLLPRAIIPVIMEAAGIPAETRVDEVTKDQRKDLIEAVKSLPITPTGLLGYRWSVITSGGISLKDVDPKTMASKKTAGLFFAGEILDLDGPTGGYNLQVCWSTGYVAGNEAGLYAKGGSEKNPSSAS